ncbi:hypothetical protein BJY21_002045 [Kineosphaera limosa]|uniref:DUF4253 domain-containing protein n=1 Tax=Kineosphaera limosa NBRC 100340 TaxID=1184609 RepID=K6VL91_9MICO|nr:DUF4253 domain-containing protein [Kineosphaera limosa]NYE00861.1 hypothetical protein [Kineosphaera limosa]GAB96988.1 hypothetical protein KILIM_053_00400 [Kineosphaera limosa NBRC 100340]
MADHAPPPVDLAPLRATPGALPADGATSVAGVEVPAGRALVVPGPSGRSIWAAPEHLTDPWPVVGQLQRAFPETGLWPLLTFGAAWGDCGYPWSPHALFGMPDDEVVPDDGGSILYRRWRANYGDSEYLDEYELPMLPWPGLVTPTQPGTERVVDPVGGSRAWSEDGQLMLVPAARPADAFRIVGTDGYNDYPPPAETVAILRSWEDRYGALPLRFCGDRLVLGIRRPPRTVEEARAAVIEMQSFSMDAFNTDDWPEAFEAMRGNPYWEFWWD